MGRHTYEHMSCDQSESEKALADKVTQEAIMTVIGKLDHIPPKNIGGRNHRLADQATDELASRHGRRCHFCRRMVWYPAMHGMIYRLINDCMLAQAR